MEGRGQGRRVAEDEAKPLELPLAGNGLVVPEVRHEVVTGRTLRRVVPAVLPVQRILGQVVELALGPVVHGARPVRRADHPAVAFSLFHFVQIEDGSATMLGAGPTVYVDEWADRMGLAIADHGKHRTVDEMVAQRIGDLDAFASYMALVFAKTESWLANVDPSTLTDVIVTRPFPPQIGSTYSARVAGGRGITRLDAGEMRIYQHGLRHVARSSTPEPSSVWAA